MDTNIGNYLVQTFLASTSIKAKLDTFVIGSTTHYAIFHRKSIPVAYQSLTKLLQIYRTSVLTPHDFNAPLYTVNCRQPTEYDADTLAEIVYNEINRYFGTYSGDRMYTQCSIGQSIPEDDNRWNTPVEVRIFSKR
jgi:hypothetical protein